jgi:hypothetical protein
VSLEQAISDNTAAVKELIGVWAKLLQQGKNINTQIAAGEVTTVAAGVVEIAVAKVEAPKPVATPTAAVTATPVPAAIAPAEAVVESPSEVLYPEVSKAITDMATANRPKVIATLAKFGVAKGTQLTADQYGDFLKALAS